MPLKELERLMEVNRFLKLEISKEDELQEITALAAKICGTPIALITLLDNDTQYLRFKVGTDIETSPRADAFCNHVIEESKMIIVNDTQIDQRFVQNPLVTGGPKIRFYAGAPLITSDGHSLGSLCVIDHTPKKLDDYQIKTLEILSKQAIHLLEFDTSLKILKELYIKAKQSANKLRSFFDASSSLHFLIGRDMNILAYNTAAKNISEEMFGKSMRNDANILDYFEEKYKKSFIANFNKCLNGQSVARERTVENKSGKQWWYVTYDPARDEEGNIIGVSLNLTDVSQKVSDEKKIDEQDLALKQIAWMQSHELRKPVSSILGLMEVIKNDDYSASKEILQMMDKVVEELDEKIRKIVDHI
jgi:PAS domain S-box-containing protein